MSTLGRENTIAAHGLPSFISALTMATVDSDAAPICTSRQLPCSGSAARTATAAVSANVRTTAQRRMIQLQGGDRTDQAGVGKRMDACMLWHGLPTVPKRIVTRAAGLAPAVLVRERRR